VLIFEYVLTISFDDAVVTVFTIVTVYVAFTFAATVAIVVVLIAFCVRVYSELAVVADASAPVIFTVPLYCSCFAVIVDVVVVVAVINYKFYKCCG